MTLEPIGPDTALEMYLDRRYREVSPYAEESPYLFVSESGPKLNGERINKIVRKAAENVRLQEVLYEDALGQKRYKITSHVIRHSFAMNFLENGGSFGDLSKMMTHSDLPTTEIYQKFRTHEQREPIKTTNPILT